MFFLDEKDVVFFDAFSLDVFHSQIANISDHQPTSDLRKHWQPSRFAEVYKNVSAKKRSSFSGENAINCMQ